MRIVIVTDAWRPQINGVVRTIERTVDELEARGHEVVVIGPEHFKTIPLLSYSEIRIALAPGNKLRAMLMEMPRRETVIHIATEGPLGWAARGFCLENGYAFSTAYHTKFPEYVRARFPIPKSWSYSIVRRFHEPSTSVMVSTKTLYDMLSGRGFTNLKMWSRGVDTELFRPRPEVDLGLPGPIQLYVGRVAVEKNLEAFLETDVPGTKLVVGDGPSLEDLKRRYPEAVFTGAMQGEDLARQYAGADIFVFPSLTDTFGLVMLEALASGLPVAAYPVTGPVDLVGDTDVAALNDDLEVAIRQALTLDRQTCRDYALKFSWAAATDQFVGNLPQSSMIGQPIEASETLAYE